MRVLFVDDEETQIELVSLNLGKLNTNLDISSVAKPTEALKLLKKGGYDCVVSDYSFPVMSGIQLCREIRKMSSVPFILYTARGSEEVAAEAFTAGVDAYIKKESELAHYIILENRIKDAVERNRMRETLERTNEDLRRSKEQLQAYVNMLEERVAERTIEIRETKERLESFMDSAPDAILIYDAGLRLLDLNHAALAAYPLGTQKRTLIGRKMTELAPGIESTERYKGFLRVLDTGEQFYEDSHRVIFEWGMGGWASTWAFRMGKNLGIIRRDVTKYETEKRRILEEEKLVALTRMSQVVAHDLRGPLGAIVQAVNVSKRDPSVQGNMMRVIELNAVKSLTMIADWRSNTRDVIPQPVEIDPVTFIDKIVETLKLPEGVKLIKKLGDKMKPIRTDPEMLRKVLNNLIENGVEAMPSGGELMVSANMENGKLIVTVSDTGVGIPDDAKEKIFTPLYTSKPGGMGLGLTYSKRAVEALGGSISFESKLGEGTTFVVELPFVSPKD
jgi:PAS domain S-box-containing protein